MMTRIVSVVSCHACPHLLPLSRVMKRPASSRSPPPLSPPPSKRKCVQSTPPPGQEMDISQALNGRQQQRTNGRSSATSVTSTPPGSPRRGRGRSATPTDSEPSRRSGRLRNPQLQLTTF